MIMRALGAWREIVLAAALLGAIGTFGQTPAPAENAIRVEISGLRSDTGQILCALYSSTQADAFPKKADKAVARLTAKIADRQAVCEFPGVAPGTFGVAVCYGENST